MLLPATLARSLVVFTIADPGFICGAAALERRIIAKTVKAECARRTY